MTLIPPFAPRLQARRRIVSPSVVALLALLSVLAAMLFLTLRSPQKDDIAWLLYVARKVLAGRELYVDVVEVNPPLIIWISAIPAVLAGWLGIASQFVAVPVFIAFVLGCVGWSTLLARRQGGLFALPMPVFALVGSVFLILPAADLGQREHLLAAAFLPYLVLFAQRLDGRAGAVAENIVAGLIAGLGCALKPRYVAVFAVLECLALTQGLRPWRWMPVAAGVTLSVYAGLVALLCPAYLERAVPMALALYGATDVSFGSLVSASATLIISQIGAAALMMWRRDGPERNLMLTMIVFAVVSSAICFVDGKDWFYHRIPATVFTALTLMLWGVAEVRRRGFSPALGVAAAALGLLSLTSLHQLAGEAVTAADPQDTTVRRLEAILNTQHARTYVAFSEWLALGFPVVNNTGVIWASRFDSMWALKGEIWRARFDPATSQEWPVARWIAHDFLAGCPDVAVVDTRETTPYIAVLSQADPAFARVWTRYRRITSFGGLVVYRRSNAGCHDVWVATGTPQGVMTR